MKTISARNAAKSIPTMATDNFALSFADILFNLFLQRWDVVKDWSMIHLALYYKNPQMVELLVKFGADINANRDGIPPLSKAVYDKNFECFKLLLELGADIELAQRAIKYSGTPEMRQLAKQYSKCKSGFKDLDNICFAQRKNNSVSNY